MTAIPQQRDLGGGLADLFCVLEGVRCGGCTSKIERSLGAIDGVALVRVNATTGRMRLVWETARARPEDLLQRVEVLGFGVHALGRDDAGQAAEPSVLLPLAVAGFGTMNVMAFSIAVWAGLVTDMGDATRQLMHWFSAAVALPVAAYSGGVFYRPALAALRSGRINMDAAITLAIVATLAASMLETVRGGEHAYFDAAVSLIFFLLIGRLLDQTLRKRSKTASANLRRLTDGFAHRLGPDGVATTVPVDDLSLGDILMVRPGERVPADGVLVDDRAEIDDSLITGESMPRSLRAGDLLIAGSLAAGSAIRLRVTALGQDTRLSAIAALTEIAETHRGQSQLLAERFAAAYGPAVIAAACLGFAVWWLVLGATVSEAVMIAVAVLIVTCPCAAGLATPAVVARAVNLLLAKGVIVRDGGALERLAQIDEIIVDRTGTLTTGILQLQEAPDREALECAAALAANSAHPLAKAIASAAPRPARPGVREIPGKGLLAPDGTRLGSASFTGTLAADTSGPSLWLTRPGQVPVVFRFFDPPRPGAKDLVEAFRARGFAPTLLSGDRAASVAAVADEVGIDRWHAEMTPEDKLDAVQQAGGRALMIGDGLNDAPALAAAHVSVSPASAIDIARNAADIVVLAKRLDVVAEAHALAVQAQRLIAQNLCFAALYNIVSVPLALAGGLTPLIAAILMSSSSLLVMLNALRLRIGP